MIGAEIVGVLALGHLVGVNVHVGGLRVELRDVLADGGEALAFQQVRRANNAL